MPSGQHFQNPWHPVSGYFNHISNIKVESGFVIIPNTIIFFLAVKIFIFIFECCQSVYLFSFLSYCKSFNFMVLNIILILWLNLFCSIWVSHSLIFIPRRIWVISPGQHVPHKFVIYQIMYICSVSDMTLCIRNRMAPTFELLQFWFHKFSLTHDQWLRIF